MIASSKKSSSKAIRSISAVVVVAMFCLGYFAIKTLLDDDGAKRQRRIQMITIVKPPPPQPPKEKPPEPEVRKKEEIEEAKPEETPPEENQSQDDTPAGDDLGVDAEGSGGADAFGLMGRKGGRSLIGGVGDKAMMQRYAWYTRMIQEEIRKRINEHMSRNGGLPEGDHKAMVKIVLDAGGRIIDYQLFGSSGDPRIDQALKATLETVQIGEAPPEGMPRALRLKVSSRG